MIYVFKTTVKTREEVQRLGPQLNRITFESDWSFDLNDCDKILSIDSRHAIQESITKLLIENGYCCVELDD